MWKNLFGMTKEQWQQMKFSNKSIRKFRDMKKITFDKKIVSFLEHCLVDDHVKLAISFSDVYDSFEDFISEIQEKIIQFLIMVVDKRIY